jgi:hypothetical protein
MGFLARAARFAGLVTGAVFLAALVQSVADPRPDLAIGAQVEIAALSALLVFPLWVGVGIAIGFALLGLQRASLAPLTSRLLAAVLAGTVAYGLLAAGLWWAIGGFGWVALVAASVVGAPWLLPARAMPPHGV